MAGVYFEGSFTFGENVAVSRFGIAVSLKNTLPVADNTDPSCLYTAANNSVLISHILCNRAADGVNSQALIYARPYALLADGTYIYGDVVSTNLKALVETIDSDYYAGLEAVEKTALNTMYQKFAATMQSWQIPNIKNNAAQ